MRVGELLFFMADLMGFPIGETGLTLYESTPNVLLPFERFGELETDLKPPPLCLSLDELVLVPDLPDFTAAAELLLLYPMLEGSGL